MSRTEIKLCDDCFHALAKNSVKAASLWSILCQSYSDPKKMKSAGITQFEDGYTHLEREGYLLSTEKGKSRVGIRLYGYNRKNRTLCLKKHSSDKKT